MLSAIIPGAGQAYAGEWKRGAVLFIGIPAQMALFCGVLLNYKLVPGWLVASLTLAALTWMWSAYDAWQTARGRRGSALILVLLVLPMNLIAAWTVTEIQIPQLAREQRNVIKQIGGGLAKPDVVARKTIAFSATGKYIVPGPGAPESVKPVPTKPGEPSIEISPAKAAKGERVYVHGTDFAPSADGELVLLGADDTTVGTFKTDPEGKFTASFVNEQYIPYDYFVQARMQVPGRAFELSKTLRDTAPRMTETIYLALLGTAFSLVFALPLSFFGARNLMFGSPLLRTIYALARGIFTVLRSVEVLIIAVIAVAAVGVGPFAGVIALALHGVGALGKLYSEAIESIEHGPIEAIRSTGANELQVVAYGVVPQVVPQFIAFTLYRWDINVRMATVIGLVGGGGIGFKLVEYMNLLQWQQAATAIWLIAGVVMLMDYASAVIREKVV